MSAEGWRDRAACRTLGPDVFFTPRGGNAEFQEAVAICAGCEVRQACLDYALANRIRTGVWGGYSARARAAIARRRAAQPAGEPVEVRPGWRRTA